ncbi:sirohydrochlorin chelatase [Phaeobacter sp.]|uniref:sirohydrochlorin chelatase n=1 Tax=Phaeobacter sp. TaxID=1902409 RepID=UPI0025E7DC2B|nr:CbiX/SirB N-terminal domain-containing protein [Phaeobacter sp.]
MPNDASATHSPDRPVAVITSHGQPSDPAPQEAALAAVAAAVAPLLPDWQVKSATLSTPGLLEETVEAGAVVYPFFMANGWFTANVLPKRLSDVACTITPPFGLDPDLPALACEALREACDSRGWTLEQTRVLLAAHGSARGPKAAEAAEAFADLMRATVPGIDLRTGYVEEDPRIADTARDIEQAQPTQNSLCLPFFAQAGEHVRDDIPEALEEAAYTGDTLPVLGALPAVPALIAKAICRAKTG